MALIPPTVIYRSGNKTGMTFKELREFVSSAMRQDAPDEEFVEIQSTWRGRIREIRVRGSVPTPSGEVRKD